MAISDWLATVGSARVTEDIMGTIDETLSAGGKWEEMRDAVEEEIGGGLDKLLLLSKMSKSKRELLGLSELLLVTEG